MLDIGCGVGTQHPMLYPVVGELSGVDISRRHIELAGARNPGVTYTTYDGRRLPFDDGSQDVCLAVGVVHHVPVDGWPRFFAEMHRVLRQGGMGLIIEHNPRNSLTRRIVDRCPFDADAVLIDRERAEELNYRAGFDGVQSRFIMTVPSARVFQRPVDRMFAWLPIGA